MMIVIYKNMILPHRACSACKAHSDGTSQNAAEKHKHVESTGALVMLLSLHGAVIVIVVISSKNQDDRSPTSVMVRISIGISPHITASITVAIATSAVTIAASAIAAPTVAASASKTTPSSTSASTFDEIAKQGDNYHNELDDKCEFHR
jgi:hypothetical protein